MSQQDQERLAQLEREAAELRAKLADEQDPLDEAQLQRLEETLKPGFNRSRAVITAIAAAAFLLLIAGTLATMMSKGFGLFADKAAKTLVPGSQTDTKVVPNKSVTPAPPLKPGKRPPSVPGL